MKKIPLCKPSINKSDIKIMINSFKTGWLTHGPNNVLFEKNFSKLIGSKYAISMNSCTSALECSLKILKKRGEVIIPSWTWVSTANAVLNTGNKPVFCDVDLNSRNLTLNEIKKKITKKTVAVIIVHYAGLPCQTSEISNFLKKKKIELIEDSAETLGATCDGKQTGSFGTGCFSFFPTKNITTAEGGMLTTNSKEKYNLVKKIIAHGIDKSIAKKPWHRIATLPGHNYRLPNHLAALGINQLKRLKKFNLKRNKVAKKYDNFFKTQNNFITQFVPKNLTHSYQMYSIIVKKERDDLLNFLNKKKIHASVHFDPPLHKQKYLARFKTNLPNTDILSKKILTLPIYPDMSNKDVDHIIKSINKWLKIKNF